jgi:hypothetical protein
MPYYDTPEGPAKQKRLQDYKKRMNESAPKEKPPQNGAPSRPKPNGGTPAKPKRQEYTPPRTDSRWRQQRQRREQRQREQSTPQVTRDVGEWPKKLQERVSTVQKLLGIFGLGGDD